MKIAIVGSRDYPRLNDVRRAIDALPAEDVVLTGDARGVDETAFTYCTAKGRKVIRFAVDKVGLPEWPGDQARQERTPEWEAYRREYARRAHERNARLVAAADSVIAFWANDSPGTFNAIQAATRLGKPYKIRRPW